MEDDWEPEDKNPTGHSAEYEAARFKIMQDQAAVERESWESFKAREKAKAKQEADKASLEEKWRQKHRDQLDRDRERLLKRGTNHGCVIPCVPRPRQQ